MAKKQPPVDIPPPSSSDDDETEEGSTSDEEQSPKKPQQQEPQNPQEPQYEEESESDSSDDETEEDDDNTNQTHVVKNPEPQIEENPSAFTIKPIVSKPVSKSPEPKTPTSKTTRVKSGSKRPAEFEEIDKVSKPVLKNQEPSKPKVTKRPAETEPEIIDKVSKSKKSKVTNGDGQSVGKVDKGKKVLSGDVEGGEVEGKKPLTKWSEEDEIMLLDGIIDYKSETGDVVVNSNMDVFYEYVVELLSVSLTKNQLSDKIRRLKKKFQNNTEKWKNDEEPVFSKPHEQKLFKLSQKIWGEEGTVTEGNDSKVESSKKKDKKNGNVVGTSDTPVANREHEEVNDTIMEDEIEESEDVWSLYPLLCASIESEASGNLKVRPRDLKEYARVKVCKFGKEKATELEEGWKNFHVLDHQLYAKRVQLISKQAAFVLDSIKH